MNVCQKLGIVGGSLSFAVVSQCFSVQGATLTQTYTVGGTGSVSGSAAGVVSKGYNSQQSLNALSGCDGDTFIAGLVTTGFTQIQGNSVRGSFGGLVSADIAVSANYEYEPVPEPMTVAGMFVAAGMGLWWKRRAAKKV